MIALKKDDNNVQSTGPLLTIPLILEQFYVVVGEKFCDRVSDRLKLSFPIRLSFGPWS